MRDMKRIRSRWWELSIGRLIMLKVSGKKNKTETSVGLCTAGYQSCGRVQIPPDPGYLSLIQIRLLLMPFHSI